MSRENSKIFPPYYLGLDIGTESIGSAITDPHYQVLRIAGKPAMSVRLFETANTAVDRRGFRTAHRRLKRRRDRIVWLRELLGEEIAKVDASFFYRLDNSDLHQEDKEAENNPHPTKGKYSLFYGEYTDVDYYREYPTIYHLRKAWMDDTVETKDIRLFYLAVQHILKYRGNFLREGEQFGDNFLSFDQIKTSWDNAVVAYHDEGEEGVERISLSEMAPGGLEDGKRILRWDLTEEERASEKFKTVARRKAFAKWIGLTAKPEEGFVKFILGDKVNPNALFGKDSYEKDDFEKFDVTAGKFDEWETEWAQKLTDGQYQLVLAAMDGYRWQLMVTLLDGHQSISDAMIAKYNQHKDDLRLFKDYLREINRKDIYEQVFLVAKDTKGEDVKNYALYRQGGKKCTKEDLYALVKKVLDGLPESNGKKEEIFARIEKDNFLARLNTSDNGVIPYQLHLSELEKILETGKKYFPMLGEKIAGAKEDYDTVAKRISSILTYRIPYFVGPLQRATKEKPGFGWVARKEGKIRPWTYDDLVDEGESGKRFIRNMTAKCTYLPKFSVLPKNSLLFSEYLVLNELNKLRVNDELLTLEQKESILENLYCNPNLKGKITAKKIVDFLKGGDKNAEIKLSKFGEELQGDMKSYRTFASILGKEKLDRSEIRAAVEKFIEYATVFESGKDAIKHFASCEESKLFSEEEKKSMQSLTYGGWGRLSKELLELELTDPRSGEIRSIIEILRETNYNLMQILTSKEAGFDFELARQKIMGEEKDTEVGYEELKEEYCSPSVRRSVWQTILVVREYVKETGALPKKVFIEVTREHERNKGAVASRHADLLKKYKEWWKGEKVARWNIRKELNGDLDGRRQEELQQDKLYLYYRQLGKCMYSLEDIDLSRLEQDYDIEHIIPQALLKDDSLTNRILVKKVLNAGKSDVYPVSPEIQSRGKEFWKALKDGNFISDETYKRLTRRTKLTDEELNAFIARQLVETAQAASLVAKWLQKEFAFYLERQGGGVMPEIVLSKAGNVSEFRKQFDLFKVRDLNDCHHAHDAYLNIVVGNVMNEKYSHAPDGQRDLESAPDDDKMDKFEKRTWNFEKTFQKGVWSYREKGYVWQPYGENATLDTVKKALKLRDFPITKMETTGTGSFYGLQRSAKGKGIQIKEGIRANVDKYGGYNGIGTSYFTVVEITKATKKAVKKEVRFVPVTIYHQNRINQGKLTIMGYLSEILGCPNDEIRIVHEKLKLNSLLEIDGAVCRLRGYTSGCLIVHNANEGRFTTDTQRYFKELLLVKGKAIKWCNGKSDAKKMEEVIGFLEGDKIRRLNSETTHSNEKKKIVLITKDANLKAYMELLEKMEKPPYCNLQGYDGYAKTVRAGLEKFEALSLYGQMECLSSLLQFFRCGAINFSLSMIGGPNVINAIRPSMNITKKSVYYIAESVCGFRSKRIPLSVPNESKK